MLPGLDFSETLVLALIALLVFRPKDLPLMMRKLGRQIASLRSMANEFRANFDELARQAELDELRREVEALKTTQPLREIEQEVLRPLPSPSYYERDVEYDGRDHDSRAELDEPPGTPPPDRPNDPFEPNPGEPEPNAPPRPPQPETPQPPPSPDALPVPVEAPSISPPSPLTPEPIVAGARM